MHVVLHDEQSAELRDPTTFTRGDRTALLRSVREANEREDKDNPVGLASNAIFAALIEKWSLTLPLPSKDPTVVDKLLAVDFNVLDDACTQVMRVLLPQTNFAETREPDSPTKPSNG